MFGRLKKQVEAQEINGTVQYLKLQSMQIDDETDFLQGRRRNPEEESRSDQVEA